MIYLVKASEFVKVAYILNAKDIEVLRSCYKTPKL